MAHPASSARWRAALIRAGVGAVTAKAYRLLRTMLNTAVEDGRIASNPCIIKGAGVERSAERGVASVNQVYAIADAIEPRFRALVLLAALAGLRFGELGALTRERIDLEAGTVAVVESAIRDRRRTSGDRRAEERPRPPSHQHPAADRRGTARTPRHLRRARSLLARVRWAEGTSAARANFHTVWAPAREAAGLPEIFFHDLRHTGNTLAAATGASTAELMHRMGHASPRAALIYQHATAERDKAIAALFTVPSRTTAHDRAELDIDLEPERSGNSLQGRERGPNSACLEASDGGMAGPHPAGELTLAEPGSLSGVSDSLANIRCKTREDAPLIVGFRWRSHGDASNVILRSG